MDKKISQLSSAAALTGTEVIPVVQGGSTVKTTAQDIADLAGGGLPYLVYTAQVDFAGGATLPTFTVFENTIGNIVWSWFTGNQLLIGTLTGAFPSNKLWINSSSAFDGNLYQFKYFSQDVDSVGFSCLDDTGNNITPNGSSIGFIEIRVYP